MNTLFTRLMESLRKNIKHTEPDIRPTKYKVVENDLI
jgi:hypothetical protein